MPSFRSTRRVNHSASDMFNLVADVEKYPGFLPLCQELRVRRRQTDSAGREVILADMRVGYLAVRESFLSRVTLDRERNEILVEYVDGPFRHLENKWSFRDVAGVGSRKSCQIDFFIDYEFRSRMLGLLMGSMFDAAFRKFADAFEDQANRVFGSRKGTSIVGGT